MARNEDVGAYLSLSNLQKACCQTLHAQETALQGFGVQVGWRRGETTGELKPFLSDTDPNQTDLLYLFSFETLSAAMCKH